MAARAKIAISLSAGVLELVDRHAAGRSRSRCIEDELQRALRAREWERLAAQMGEHDAAEQLAWADATFAPSYDELARQERVPRRALAVRRRKR